MTVERKRFLQIVLFRWVVTRRTPPTLAQAAAWAKCTEAEARDAIATGAPMDGAVLELKEDGTVDAYYCEPRREP